MFFTSFWQMHVLILLFAKLCVPLYVFFMLDMIRHSILYICMLLSAATSLAQDITTSADTLVADTTYTLPWPQSMQARLDSIIGEAKMLETSQMGFLVYDLDDDSVLYARDHRQVIRPASTMKLITAITALDQLGTDYEYSTRVCYTGKVMPSATFEQDSTQLLMGDIYIIGGMDPKISEEDISTFAKSIRSLGVDTICGNIYADRSMKDSDQYGEGWCWDDDNAILSPLVYKRKDNMIDVLLTALSKEKVFLDGNKGEKKCPQGAKVAYELRRPLEDVLQPMMKLSNNLYAESMYYQIGLTQGRPATAKKAQTVEEAIMKKAGAGDAIHRFADGSGLSLYNYLSAEIEVAFLRYAFKREAVFDALYRSLPIAAVDGTIKDRMAGTPAAGNVHAKTGTLSGVSSLAGYLTAPNGHRLAFSIMNQGVMRGIYAKNLQDKLCAAMCR